MVSLENRLSENEELAFLKYLDEEDKYKKREKEEEKEKGIPKYSRRKNPCSWSFYQRYYESKLQGEIFLVDPNLGMHLKKDGHMDKIPRMVSSYLKQPIRYVWENIKVSTKKGIYDECPNLYRYLSSKKILKFFPKK